MADPFALAQAAFAAQHQALITHPDVVTHKSRPIAWFGDTAAYATSPLRVMTSGLNPSQVEFPTEDPDRRFPAASGVTAPDQRYLSSLNAYFHTDPYWKWFNTYRAILDGLDASFDGRTGTSTALHTDLCSPVPTSPTWSRLPGAVQHALAGPGVALWHDLVRALRPHVVLLSVARRHLDKIALDPLERDWSVLHAIDQRKAPYLVLARRYDADGHPVLVVWGRAANTPFGSISYRARHEIGALIREEVR